ncbi:MAG: site-specific DNA-methyltransferase, partial [Sedimentisphaerales bacterium]|nr:site-specific DNA-methyltransferase [Sedimentisphaerales bacterium]
MILGDSLLVMTSLAEKEGLKGKVQMIYIDPPYGIKFGSNWQVSTRKRDVKDGKAQDATRQPEQIRAFRDTWELGIHSYLSYWRDRLIAVRELLTETGSVFIQIGDENVHLVRCLMDEVFGTNNFVSEILFAKTTGFSGDYLSSVCDVLLWYGKSRDNLKYRALYQEKSAGDEGASKYRPVKTMASLAGSVFDPERLVTSDQLTSQEASVSVVQEFPFHGKKWFPPRGMHWKTTIEGMVRLDMASRIIPEGRMFRYARFMDDFPVYPQNNVWMDVGGIQSRTDPKVYVVQTSTEAIKRCMLMSTDPGDLVLDPTCGSGTTSYVAEQWGRRWITIDTSRVALALARTRLMTGRYPYYLLADSQEGIKKEAEITGKMPPPYKTDGDIKKGFVYERVTHIMLKDIANNEEIDVIHAKWQEKLEPVRATLNKLLKTSFEEWEIPREAGKDWPKEAKGLLDEWWQLRQRRQKEIDDSIARNAETEMLYDKPYVDNKRIRVTGPFTVESLSPHRTISFEEKKDMMQPNDLGFTTTLLGAGQFANIIVDNLKKAGVQNTIKNERLKFDRLEVHPGVWIHAEGEYTSVGAGPRACPETRRVAVCIGPEHGTVGPDLVREAAKEAVQGIGYDLLIVCGFAFDPHVSEEAKRYGQLTVLPTRINADLQMGDEFLKKSSAANLFMVFGEPDLEVQHTDDGKIVVEIKGLDIYDPTTGEIRSNSTDDIACWFVDTNYNGESFFVRHAYFTGADKPYEKLKRALRADVNEEAWSMLYSTKSRPFDPPERGKIAVKVINHYGDEVLKVYETK